MLLGVHAFRDSPNEAVFILGLYPAYIPYLHSGSVSCLHPLSTSWVCILSIPWVYILSTSPVYILNLRRIWHDSDLQQVLKRQLPCTPAMRSNLEKAVSCGDHRRFWRHCRHTSKWWTYQQTSGYVMLTHMLSGKLLDIHLPPNHCSG